MPTPELAIYMLDLCSYIITRIRKQHIFIAFKGAGGNGKTLFFRLLNSMLKELMATMNVKLIMGKDKCDANDASPYLHRCMGRLVAATQEPNSIQLFNKSICITMGSGDTMSARALYNNSVEFELNALIIIN